jgi:hypothetical protein
LTNRVVFNDYNVLELKTPRLVGPKAGVGCEKNIVVKLLRFPSVTRRLRLLRAFAGGFVELFIFLGREAGVVRDFWR